MQLHRYTATWFDVNAGGNSYPKYIAGQVYEPTDETARHVAQGVAEVIEVDISAAKAQTAADKAAAALARAEAAAAEAQQLADAAKVAQQLADEAAAAQAIAAKQPDPLPTVTPVEPAAGPELQPTLPEPAADASPAT